MSLAVAGIIGVGRSRTLTRGFDHGDNLVDCWRIAGSAILCSGAQARYGSSSPRGQRSSASAHALVPDCGQVRCSNALALGRRGRDRARVVLIAATGASSSVVAASARIAITMAAR